MKFEAVFFEDVQIGEKCKSVGRTVTEADIVNFAGLSGDFNLIHTDAEYAKNSIAGQRLAHGLLIKAMASGLYTRTANNMAMSENIMALVEIKAWKFKKPVVIGDTIKVEVTVMEKVDDKPDNNSGKIIMKRTVLNQRNEVVQEGEYVLLVRKRNNKIVT